MLDAFGALASMKRIESDERLAVPFRRQLCTSTRWPAPTQVCATSCEPKPAEPPRARPLRASNRARSQSLLSDAAERTVTNPAIGALYVVVDTPRLERAVRAWQSR